MEASDQTNEEASERGSGFSMFRLLIAGLVALLLYGLSVGPAEKFYKGRQPARVPILAFYYPLAILCEHCRPADRFFDWYVYKVWKA